MGFNNRLGFAKLPLVQADRDRQMNLRSKPEFRLSIRVCHVNMNTRLLAREEKKTKLTFTKYGWCHMFLLYINRQLLTA